MTETPVKVRCPKCGRIVNSRVPGHADGSLRRPYRHNRPDGNPCDGHFSEGEWVSVADPGPQRGPSSVGKIEAERRAVTTRLDETKNSRNPA